MTDTHQSPFCPSCGHNLVADQVVHLGNWSVSPSESRYKGLHVPLTPQQQVILHTVAAGNGRTVGKNALLNRSSDAENLPNIITVQVCRIRKVTRRLGIPSPIETVWGRGFRWNTNLEQPK